MVMDRSKKKPADDAEPKAWRNVGLMPLSREQMREFAVLQGVPDPDALLADIRQRDAEEFAERPQDLVELCSDWREHHRIRSHREQVETNIATKLKPSIERKERAELSQETAIEGASRLALAAMLTRKLTLRHSADVRQRSCERGSTRCVQDFAGLERRDMGRVAGAPALRLRKLRPRPLPSSVCGGVSRCKAARCAARPRRLDQVDQAALVHGDGTRRTNGQAVDAPGCGVAGPFARYIFDDIVALDPAVVLDHGDPQSLRPAQRVRALEAYVDRYGRGGWRGLSTPRIQVHRFASPELTDSVKRLWDQGIENPEVRDLLLQMVAAGKLDGCADIAYAVAMDGARTVRERSLAIEALLQLNDPRLEALSVSVETDPARWPDAMARHAVLDLFPTYMPVARLSQILRRVKEKPRSVGELNYRLPREIETAGLSPEYLDQLRQALTDLIIDGHSVGTR